MNEIDDRRLSTPYGGNRTISSTYPDIQTGIDTRLAILEHFVYWCQPMISIVGFLFGRIRKTPVLLNWIRFLSSKRSVLDLRSSINMVG